MIADASSGQTFAKVSVDHHLYSWKRTCCVLRISHAVLLQFCADQLRLAGTAKGVFAIPRIDLLANVRPKKHFGGEFMTLTEQDVRAIPQDLTCRAIDPACTNLMQWPIVAREILLDNKRSQVLLLSR